MTIDEFFDTRCKRHPKSGEIFYFDTWGIRAIFEEHKSGKRTQENTYLESEEYVFNAYEHLNEIKMQLNLDFIISKTTEEELNHAAQTLPAKCTEGWRREGYKFKRIENLPKLPIAEQKRREKILFPAIALLQREKKENDALILQKCIQTKVDWFVTGDDDFSDSVIVTALSSLGITLLRMKELNSIISSGLEKLRKTKFKETEIGMIPENWDVVTVPDVASNFDYKRKPLSSAERSKMIGKYPYYGAAGIIDYVNDFKYDGDYLLIAEDGTVTCDGSKPMLQLPHGKFWVSNHAHVLQCKSYKDTLFLYYQLKNTSVTPFITGAVQPKLNQKNLNKIKFFWTSINDERHTITKILSDFDAKIELNQQMNKTLEAISQVLFKYWFVDFEFQNEQGKPYKSSGGKMIESELGEIPGGWEIGARNDIAEVGSGKRPNQKSDIRSNIFSVELIGASSVMGYVQETLYSESIIVTGRVGTHGIVQRITKPSWPSDNTLVIKPKYYEYVFQCLKRIDYNSLNIGSTQPLITQTQIKKQEILIPDNRTLEIFESLVSKLYEKVVSNNGELDNLASIRDSLLPKLMSGKIRVPIEVKT